MNKMTMMGCVALAGASLTVSAISTLADTPEWFTGGSTAQWGQATKCEDSNGVCIEINQPGLGAIGPFGTQDCWRRQIWTTIIEGVPTGVNAFKVERSSGRWQFGVDRVEFGEGSIVVRTFVVQDHGGQGNPCLAPGNGFFVLRFSKSG
ncbi:hypothetical protein N185_16430 [Sinorhizobium sp. GW3]|nr:hypothetical protein N185_16430 [Sinorhizobium sp. GW3]